MEATRYARDLAGGVALAFVVCTSVPVLAAPPLVWQTGEGFRSAKAEVPATGKPGFTLLPPADTGIGFTNRLTDAMVAANRLLENGSGVALGDVDGDGWVDIYFCRLDGGNVLYRNLGGWKFEEVTAASGVACPGQFSTGCALADIDGDGDLDLLVNSLGGGTRAFLNDGRGRFTEVADPKLAKKSGATSMALADVDGDGDLDLYVTHYRTDTVNDNPPGLRMTTGRAPDGSPVVEPRDRFLALPNPGGPTEVLEKGEGDQFYVNKGGGNFIPAPWHVGVFLDEDGQALKEAPPDWGLAAMFRDLDGDGLPDLYVCNDFVYWPDRIWLNQGGKRFKAAPRTAFRHYSLSSMAVDAADIDRDGFDDLFVAEMLSPRRQTRAWQRPFTLDGILPWPVSDPEFRPEVPRNTLHLARGDGTYADIAPLAGVAATDWTWSAAFLDVDLDGWEDLLIANGSNHDVQDADVMAEVGRTGAWRTPEKRLQFLARMPRREVPSMAFRNRRDLTFEDAGAAWGFDTTGVAQGMALADLDNDGDLDVVINCLNGPARVLRNDSSAPRVAVRLKGAGGNTRGIGAKIKVLGGPVTQTQQMMAGGRYCSSDDPMRVFAAGTAKRLSIEVVWRNGKRTVVDDVMPDRIYEIDEAAARPSPPAVAAPPALFRDVSASVRHVHIDEPYDDFARQPLLPRKLSTLGPGVAWADVDGDGTDDLVVAGGKTGRTVVFRNDGLRGLIEWTNAPVPPSNPRDQTGVAVWRVADGTVRIVSGASNWEDSDADAAPFVIATLKGAAPPAAKLAVINHLNSTGPVAMADIDGDGDLDLFIGGRAVAGRYPEPATSLLLRNDGGVFVVAQTFADIGLVSGAVSTDFDGDGDADLALACDWGPVRLLRNDGGKFTDVTTSYGMTGITGCWNGITTADLDGDGRMDLVVSNWGRNWRVDPPSGSDLPARLYYGDLADNGGVQTLLASMDPQLSMVTPWRQWKTVAALLPAVAGRVPDHHSYGRASIATVLGDHAASAREWVASTSDSMVFLNRGDRFEARAMPLQAQFAPAFGVSVADFDGDGNEDVFLAQNFFGMDIETARQDAGAGLVLLGDGRGGFRALGPLASGVSIHGEQRGSAVGDLDGDGRPDLAVGQQNGPVRLLRNQTGRPGVRVALRGPKDNPDAVGAIVRLRSGDRSGPAREVHAGHGYWSQDSATVLLAAPSTPTGLQVRWPGGKSQEFAWPAGARSVEVSTEGIRGR